MTRTDLKKIFTSRALRISISLAFSLVFLYLAFRNISWLELWAAASQADPAWVFLAAVCVLFNQYFKVARWQILLGPPGRQVRFQDLTLALLSGQMLNLLLPVRIGDLTRAYTIGGKGPGRAFTFGSIILEKILDLVWYVLLLALLLLTSQQPAWLEGSISGLALATAGMVLAAFLIAFYRRRFMAVAIWGLRWLPVRWENYLVSRLESAVSSLDVIQKPSDLLAMNLWSAAVWGSAALTNYLCLLAMGLHLEFSAALLLLAALQAGIVLTNIPGRIGIFEYICILSLSVYGVEQTQALAYGLLLHAVALGIPALLGIIAFWFQGTRGQRPDLDEALRQV